MFTEKNCNKCVHDLRGACPIWALHLTRNYDQCKDTEAGKTTKEILNALIPQDEDGFARKCLLFHPYTTEEKKESSEEINRNSGLVKVAPWIEEWMRNRHGQG